MTPQHQESERAMGANTKIEWTDHTFNPWRGCTKISAGCASCYAETLSKRNPGTLGIWGPNGTRVIASEAMWKEPLKWNRSCIITCDECGHQTMSEMVRRDAAYGPGDLEYTFDCICGGNRYTKRRPRVFCASLSDVFEDWDGYMHNHNGTALCKHPDTGKMCLAGNARYCAPFTIDDARKRLFDLIDATPNLDWLLLTKRPENIRRIINLIRLDGGTTGRIPEYDHPDMSNSHPYYRRNIWIGCSIATQADADRNIPELLKCRDLAPVLFVSAEPLIDEVDISKWLESSDGFCSSHEHGPIHRLDGGVGLNWAIVGGESGANARPCRPEWIRSIVKQCLTVGTPCFVKQLGSNIVTRNDMVEDQFNSLDNGWPDPHVGGDWNEWPEDLRVREFPEVSHPDDLKPCPFCGGKAVMIDDNFTQQIYVLCLQCCIKGLTGRTAQEAAAKWNTRFFVSETTES